MISLADAQGSSFGPAARNRLTADDLLALYNGPSTTLILPP